MSKYLRLVKPKSLVILGFPLEHSASPLIHNYGFSYHNLDFVYTAMPIDPKDLSKLGKDFLNILPIYGGNVTVPFKEIIFNYLQKFTDIASELGAVNTFYKKDGELWGDNTDLYGFTRSLENYKEQIKNNKVIVLGTGGSSKSVCSGFFKLGAKEILVISREYSKANTFADNYNQKYSASTFIAADYSYFDDNNLDDINLVVNTTPVGMYQQESAISEQVISRINKDALFYDLIYKPATTTFLEYAKLTGHPILNGKSMLVYQAAKSFKIWTGHDLPVDDIFSINF